jgi:putative effector of murein hydrolase LrgA (UPF0299 family)
LNNRQERGLRTLLVLQAVVSTAIGMWGIFWSQLLESFLGLRVPASSFGLARLFGAAMLGIAVAYALAAAQPHRSRGFLVPLFLVPLVMGIAMIVNVAQGDVAHSVRSVIFAVYSIAYCLLYFRVYPRVVDVSDAVRPPDQPPST